MCGFLFISKKILIEKWHLIVPGHKSRKRIIQSWISIPQNMSHDIYNAVKKKHKRNGGHDLNIYSDVKFGIAY